MVRLAVTYESNSKSAGMKRQLPEESKENYILLDFSRVK
jgi:hypothetical protein